MRRGKKTSKITNLLENLDFGREIEADNDPVFLNTVSDSYRILKTIINTGKEENHILFQKPVYFAITDSVYPTAAGIAEQDHDIVFLTNGYINKIRRTICKLLAQPSTFRTIGSPDKEKYRQEIDDNETLLPQSSERREFANGAIQRALEYVFIHELAHLFYGHNSYLEKLDDSVFQSPFLMAPPKGKGFVRQESYTMEIQAVRHAMEIQADRYAGDVTLGFAFREIWEQRPLAWPTSDNMLKNLEKRAIQELGIALTVVFNIGESINSEFHTHPHPKYRQLATTMSAHVVWMAACRDKSKNIHIDQDEFLNIINDIQDETNTAWRHTNLPSIDSISNLSELEFHNLLLQAIQLFPKLDSRFDKHPVV